MTKAKLPKGIAWRDGRPRWIAAPQLRRAGWRGRDLKDARGNWLSFEQARTIGQAINRDVDLWKEGKTPRTYQPDDGTAPAPAISGRRDEQSMIAAWERYRQSRYFLKLADTTRKDYAGKIQAFLSIVGDEDPAFITRDVIEQWYDQRSDQLFALRGLGWTAARWTAASQAAKADVRFARHADLKQGRRNTPGLAQVNGEIAVIRRVFSYTTRVLTWTDFNPAAGFGTEPLAPRVRVIDPAEQAALIQAAENQGRPEVADALIIGIYTGARLGDVLAMTWADVQNDRFTLTPAKTRRTSGAVVDAPQFSTMAARLAEIKARPERAGDGAGAAIIRDSYGRFSRTRFAHIFADIRAVAEIHLKSCAAVLFKDTRDTAVTNLAEAGCTPFEIAGITGHSLRTVDDILKHYFAPTRTVADNAMAKLEAHHRAAA